MAQFAEMRISEKSSKPVKTMHGDELEQQPWPNPSAPATIHPTEAQISNDQHHGDDEYGHPHKKSVLQKVKDKAKKLIKKKKKPSHGRGNDHREEEEHHHFEEEDEGDEEDDDDTEEEEEKTVDLNPPDFRSRPLADASAVSPGFDAYSARTLLNGSQLARDPEAPETGVQSTSRDPNVAAGVASDRRALSPAETARRQKEVPAAPGQSSAGITPILQSTEGAYSSSVRDPDYDVRISDVYFKDMAHQVQDIGTGTAAPGSAHHVLATKTEFDGLPNYNRRKEAQENVLHGEDETERIGYRDANAKSPTLPAGFMKPVIVEEAAMENLIPVMVEEPAMENLIQRAGEVCGFDTNKGDIGDPTVKDQNPSATHGDWEESRSMEPISNKFKKAEDKLGGTEINRHSNDSDELTAQDASSEEWNENAGLSATMEAAISVVGTAIGVAQGLKDRIAMGLGGTDPHANENDKERENEEGAGHGRSYTENFYGPTSTAKNAIVSKLGYGEHHEPVDEMPNKLKNISPDEDNYENNEGGKSYRDKIYDTASAAKNVISSKLGYGEHQGPVQEETQKKTDWPSADHDEGAREEGGKSFTDKICDKASAANSVVSTKFGYGRQEDPVVEEKPEGQTIQKHEHEHDTGEGKSYTEKIYETATAAKNAISSKIGYGGNETVQDHEQRIDEVSKGESNAHPVGYSN